MSPLTERIWSLICYHAHKKIAPIYLLPFHFRELATKNLRWSLGRRIQKREDVGGGRGGGGGESSAVLVSRNFDRKFHTALASASFSLASEPG